MPPRLISLLPRRRETLDARFYVWVNGLPRNSYWNQQIELLSDLGKGMGWAAGSIWLAARDGARGRRAAIATMAGMLAAIGLVQGPLKATFKRNRPFASRLAVVVGPRPVDSSFPSGHTAGSFAAAVVLSSFYPRHRSLLLGVASAVGFSRVYLGHHFGSDVLVGAAVGSGLGGLAAGLFRIRIGQPLDAEDGAPPQREPTRRRRPHRRRALVRPHQDQT